MRQCCSKSSKLEVGPMDLLSHVAGSDTKFYEQWYTEPPAQKIWWSYNFFSGPDNNNTCKSWTQFLHVRAVFPHR